MEGERREEEEEEEEEKKEEEKEKEETDLTRNARNRYHNFSAGADERRRNVQ